MIKRGIGDGKGTNKSAHLHQYNGDVGVVTFVDQLRVGSNLFQPATNPTLGNEMAIDASFSGTPDGIHNGTDTALWTGSAISGTWDFASATDPDTGSLCVENISNTAGDEALFTRSSSIDSASFAGMSGRVRLEQWGGSPGDKHIALQFRLAGVNVGGVVNIDDFIDTGVLNVYQTFNVNFTDFGFESGSIDELVIQKVRTSGPTPKYRLDNMQVEEAGGNVTFSIEAPVGKRLIVSRLYISYADVVDITVTNGTAIGLNYKALMGEAALPNGIVYQIKEDGKVVSSISTSTVGDNLKGGALVNSIVSDASNNTCVTLEVLFGGPLVLDSRYDDAVNVIIGDDLTGLESFTVLASGRLEAVNTAHRPEAREG